MNKTTQNIFRWLAVLPGSIAAGIAATFFLHYILYFTLTNFVTPYPEFPERALTPFVIAAIFIWAGSEIAPNHKLKTGVGLFSIWIFFAGGLIVTTLTGGKWFGRDLQFDARGIAPILGIVGAFVGLYLVWKKNKENLSPNIKEEYKSESEDKNSTNDVSFYNQYGTDIFNSVFVALFVWCLFNTTSRMVVFIVLIILNLFLALFSWKQKLYTTTTMKINLAKNIIIALLLLVGLFNADAGYYVTLLCLILQTFDMLRHLIKKHFISKTSTTAQE